MNDKNDLNNEEERNIYFFDIDETLFHTYAKILVRNRSWEELRQLQEGGHELAWKDIVDGKQKLYAMKTFMENEYPDLNGNYFEDLSDVAQRRLTNHQLMSYSELPENTKDEDVLRQFLRLNFSGVPQSQEHLEYIKSLL